MKKRYLGLLAAGLSVTTVLSLGSVSMAYEYTVKKGDNLWNIAKEELGNGALYRKIYEANAAKITDPRKIQIGQILEIPDVVSSATTKPEESKPEASKPEVTPDNLSQVDRTSFEEYIKSTNANLIKCFDTMEVGETAESVMLDRFKVTIVKAAENVMAYDCVLPENTINETARMFLYKVKDGYQSVAYYTRRNDGLRTYRVDNVSSTGESTPIYFTVSSGILNANKADKLEIDAKDVLAGYDGKFIIETVENGTYSTQTQTYVDENGNKLIETDIATITKDDTSETLTISTFPDGTISKSDFTTIQSGNKSIRTINVSDAVNSGILSYVEEDGKIVYDSITYKAYDAFGDIMVEREEDSFRKFNVLKNGEKAEETVGGVTTKYTKISPIAMVVEHTFPDGNNAEFIYMQHGKGYMSLSNAKISDDSSLIAFYLYDGNKKSSVCAYASSTKDAVGEENILQVSPKNEKLKLDTKMTENADGTKTKDVTYSIDEEVINKSVVNISADGKTITSKGNLMGEEYTFTFQVDDKNGTIFTVDSDHGDAIVKYNVVNNRIVADSVSVEFKPEQ